MPRVTVLRRRLFLCGATLAASGLQSAAAAQQRTFAAKLAPEDETFPVESRGSGAASLTLNLDTLLLRWELSWRDLSSPIIGAHIHGPGQMFTNALPLFDLAPKGVNMPLRGEGTVTEALVQYMISTWSYVNLATARYRDGEIRGQIQGVAVE